LYRQLDSWDVLADQARAMVDVAIDAVQRRHPGLSVKPHVVGDTPLRDLLDVAASARTVVVGRRGTGPVPARRLGSTSRGLVEFAPCPVVVTPPAGR
jgi:nucleotide-binding universal stress UspA family protein